MALELGALHLAIRDQGGSEVLDKLKALDERAKAADRTMQQVGKRQPFAPLKQSVKALNADLTAFIADLRLVGQSVGQMGAAEVSALRQAAAASIDHYRAMGATDVQQRKLTAAVMQFERQVQAAAVAEDRLTAAQAKSANVVTVLGQKVTNAAGNMSGFGKVSLGAINAVAFGLSQLASTGELSFRSLAGSASSVLAFFGPKGAIASAVISVGLAFTDAFRKARQEIADTRAKAEEEAARLSRSLILAFRKGDVGTFAKMMDDLKVGTETSAGILDVQAQIAQRTTDIEEARARGNQARVLILTKQKQALTAELTALELRRDKLLDVVATLAGPSDGHGQSSDMKAAAVDMVKLRSQEIAALSELAKLGMARATELPRLKALEELLTQELQRGNMAVSERVELLRQLMALGEARTLALGGAGAQIGTIATPGLAATPDGRDPRTMRVAALPSAQRMKELFGKQAKDMTDAQKKALAEERARVEDAFATTIGNMIASGLASGIAAGFQDGFSAGALADGFRMATANFLSGLGAMAIEIGVKAKILGGLLGWLQNNPWAALAVGVALVAFGSAIGGRRGAGSGGVAPRVGGDAGAGIPDGRTRLRVADRGTLPPAAQLSSARATAMPAPVVINLQTVNPADPATQRLLTQTIRNAERRGY